MDLLSPQEANAFQSFLSAMDYAELSPNEWALLNGPNPPDEDGIFPRASHAPSEALAKATKDLMSLGAAGRWESFSQQLHDSYPSQPRHHLPDEYALHHSRCETFPFLNPKSHLQQQGMQQPLLSLTPHTSSDFHSQIASSSETSTSASTTTTPASPHSPFHFPPDQPSSHNQLPQAQLHQSLSRQRGVSSSSGVKRSSGNSTAKRRKQSPSSAAAPPSSSSSATTPPKQSLLSPSQKKANHIQSEQKRRANIRRGYEALCDTVPALREAIREEEEAEAKMNSNVEAGSSGKPSRSKRKRKEAATGDGDKMDGRAGPRSENVVLSKTIEYIQDLVNERSALLARLERAKMSLSIGHPALVKPSTPLWEREWKGGEGKFDGADDDDDDGCDSS